MTLKVVPMQPIEALGKIREDLMLEHTRLMGQLHVVYEETALLEARKQRLQERINAVDDAVHALKSYDA